MTLKSGAKDFPMRFGRTFAVAFAPITFFKGDSSSARCCSVQCDVSHRGLALFSIHFPLASRPQALSRLVGLFLACARLDAPPDTLAAAARVLASVASRSVAPRAALVNIVSAFSAFPEDRARTR